MIVVELEAWQIKNREEEEDSYRNSKNSWFAKESKTERIRKKIPKNQILKNFEFRSVSILQSENISNSDQYDQKEIRSDRRQP